MVRKDIFTAIAVIACLAFTDGHTFGQTARIVPSPGPELEVSVFAGSGEPGTPDSRHRGMADGIGTEARFWEPRGISSDGRNIYVPDRLGTVRKIALDSRTVTTLSKFPDGFDGPGGGSPDFQASWTDGSNLYVADRDLAVRKIVLSTGTLTTFAGKPGASGSKDGVGPDARFLYLLGIWGDGTSLFVTDTANCTIRKIELATAEVSTFAGKSCGNSNSPRTSIVDGVGSAARLANPSAIWGDGTSLYVTDSNTIRRIDIKTRAVRTIAGSKARGYVDARGKAARFYNLVGLWGDGTNLYVADYSNGAIRKIALGSMNVTTVAGPNVMTPWGIWGDGINLYVSDPAGARILKFVLR